MQDKVKITEGTQDYYRAQLKDMAVSIWLWISSTKNVVCLIAMKSCLWFTVAAEQLKYRVYAMLTSRILDYKNS